MLDCQLFGLRAGGHHLVSLGFHVANTLLLLLGYEPLALYDPPLVRPR